MIVKNCIDIIQHRIYSNFLSLFLISIGYSCQTKSQENIPQIKDITVDLGAYSIIDTLKLNSDSVNFRFSNIEKFRSDSLLLFNYPDLDLHFSNIGFEDLALISLVSDSKGGFQGSFIEPLWDLDNNIIIVEQGNIPMLTFFDSNFQFVKKLKLNEYIDENFYLPSIASRAKILKNDSKKTLLMTSESMDFMKNTKDFFSSSYVFLKVVLDSSDNYLSHSFHLRLNEYDEIKKSIKTNKRYWSSSIPKFDVYNDKVYVVYEFSDQIFIYDLNFNLEKIIPIQFYNQSFTPFSVGLNNGERSDPNESVKIEFLLRHSKPQIVDIKVDSNRIALLYNEVVEKNKIPSNIFEENNYLYHSFLQVINNTDGKSNQLYIPLADDFSPYGPIFLENKSILINKNFNKSDGYEILEIIVD
ncbi:hypothetical protein [Aquiflexum gelatinilyticum]|uniref:Uncharacterized protein n=1 Tax=Aquiflexum gelatinilyticum TaxID=2961943 RepID=A0A9X2P801_9BACT|nr:hypothetical protein [Aquiflexum gelatinilyticum]MCR9016516.1 hypothetical protein [Aquiflexum gelatinilyticum]MCS4436579.1 hypothetical protein [Aquiflexum gelatinilyticum]